MKSSARSLPVHCLLILFAVLGVSGCRSTSPQAIAPVQATQSPGEDVPPPQAGSPEQPYPTRPPYPPGELVDYTAQTGDTLYALAQRFNTSIEEILAANTFIPNSATTMPPGMPMKIPIYYRPLWGNPYQIIPDSLFINGPAQIGFSAEDYVKGQPGWLKNHVEFVGGENRRGGAIVDFVAEEYGVSPRLLLAVAEYLSGALTQPQPPDDLYMLGKADYRKEGFYRQIAWVADTLNTGYYSWRTGQLLELTLSDGRLERPDPWQNAATVTLQSYFASILPAEQYHQAISNTGIAQTYQSLFGDPWANVTPHLPGSLEQPQFNLPFEQGKVWAYTGGPHSAWGEDAAPLAAIDFAPPSVAGGCIASPEWVTAVADGVIARKATGIAILDLDGDGDEHTGWVIFHLHLETASIPPVGTQLKAGERIGHPSCEGGQSTGTHVHMARKYNGEWILAGDIVPFNLEGWIVKAGSVPYLGTMTRNGKTIIACTCSDQNSHVQSQATLSIQP